VLQVLKERPATASAARDRPRRPRSDGAPKRWSVPAAPRRLGLALIVSLPDLASASGSRAGPATSSAGASRRRATSTVTPGRWRGRAPGASAGA